MAKRDRTQFAKWTQDTLQKGLNALNAGRVEEAHKYVRKVLKVSNDSMQAHFLAALIALQLGHKPSALKEFRVVTTLDPQNPDAWAHVAQLYMELGHPNDAENALKQAIQYSDNSPNVEQIIATVFSLLGKQREALSWYEKSTAKQPANIGFCLNHANCLMFLGEIDRAEELLKRVLRMNPTVASAHWLLAGLKRAKDVSHLQQMQQLISTQRFLPPDVAYLQYACGKELEDLEDWGAAFDAFATGAAARRTTVQYDEQAEIDLFDTLQRVYTVGWLETGERGISDASPIFVVGEPRSGTTLVERVISAHSSVQSAGELNYFTNGLLHLAGRDGAQRVTKEVIEVAATLDFSALGESYVENTTRFRESAPYFVDKLPSNYLYIPLILKALPDAKIVHLRRSPMDSCFSTFKQLFLGAYEYSYDQEELARHYVRYYQLMDVWRDRFGDRFHDVTYEDFVRNLESNARSLIEFLDLPWEDQCVHFHEQDSAVTTASAVQVRQPAHTRSIGRWRHYSSWLEPMRKVLETQNVPLEL